MAGKSWNKMTFKDVDQSRFIHLGAQWKYMKDLQDKPMIIEEGFDLGGELFNELNKEIDARGWRDFCAPPRGYSEELVKEFYSNLNPYEDEDLVWVRGVKVLFDRKTINKYYGIKAPGVNEYDLFNRSRTPKRIYFIKDALC